MIGTLAGPIDEIFSSDIECCWFTHYWCLHYGALMSCSHSALRRSLPLWQFRRVVLYARQVERTRTCSEGVRHDMTKVRWALPMEDVAIVTIPGVHLKRIWGHCRTREIAVNLPVVLSANSVHILNEARPASFGQGDLGKIHSMMGGSNWRVGVYDCLACLFIEIGIAN